MVSYRVRRLLLVGAALALVAPVVQTASQAPAQQALPKQTPARDWTNDIPAHLSYVDGSVTLERDGRFEPAEANVPLLAGDRITTRTGRVEVLFADGSSVAVDQETNLEFLDDALIRLDIGRIRIRIERVKENLEYRIDTKAGTVWIDAAGEYKIDAAVDRRGDPEVDLIVFRGSAELVNDHGSTVVGAGSRSVTSSSTAPSRAVAVNSAAQDDFDRWAEEQRVARSSGTVSDEYLPEELDSYSGAFDTYGSWDYYAPHGQVWYPRVAAGWRPYYQGRWGYTGYYGWNWVGIDRWSWPTHHYGSWGYNRVGWYWIPGYAWAPANVYWGGAPGYVGWCPLGYNGYPVIGYNTGYFGYATGYVYTDAWTVIPNGYFVPNAWVTTHAVRPENLPASVRAAFVPKTRAPVPDGAVVARRTIQPLRGPIAPQRTAPTPAAAVAARGKFEGARVPAATSATKSSVIRGGGIAVPTVQGNAARPAAAQSLAADRQTGTVERGGGTRALTGRELNTPVTPERAEPARTGNVERPSSGATRSSTPKADTSAPEHRGYSTRERETARSAAPERAAAPDRTAPQSRQAPSNRQTAPSGQAEPRSEPPQQAQPDRSRPSGPSGPPPASYGAPKGPSGPPASAAPPPRPSAPPSQAPPQQAAPPPSRTGPPPASGSGGGGRGRGGDK